MRTKRITLFYKLTPNEVLPPPAKELARKESWLTELRGTVESEWKPLLVRVVYEMFDPEVEQQQKFFNGVCVLYYAIQNMELLKGEPDSKTLANYREEILDEMLGYDIHTTNKVIRTRKSTTDFKSVQAWSTFLKTLEENLFDAAGYDFPDSKVFWELAKKHGYDEARAISLRTLQADMARKLTAKI